MFAKCGCSWRTRTLNERTSPASGNTAIPGSSFFVNLQSLLLDKIHNRHDGGRLRQLDAQLGHDRPHEGQEVVEGLPALPDIEDLKLAPASRRRSRSLECCSEVIFFVTM